MVNEDEGMAPICGCPSALCIDSGLLYIVSIAGTAQLLGVAPPIIETDVQRHGTNEDDKLCQ